MRRCIGLCRLQPLATERLADAHEDGRRYCSECQIAFRPPGHTCPCCGTRMRQAARQKVKQDVARIT